MITSGMLCYMYVQRHLIYPILLAFYRTSNPGQPNDAPEGGHVSGENIRSVQSRQGDKQPSEL